MPLHQTHGWLLPKLLQLDADYQGRYTIWRHTLETGTVIPPEPTQFLAPHAPGFDSTLTMLNGCLHQIAPNASLSRNLLYFCDWLLFSLGHPSQLDLPIEPSVRNPTRLAHALDLEPLLRCPADYIGHLLALERYGQQRNRFYPTLPTVAETMATLAVQTATRSGHRPPFHAVEPCLGTGRLALAASNHCRSMMGWEQDRFLLKAATVNFMLYAPDFALPIPGLGGDLVVGDSLMGQGRSFVSGKDYSHPLVAPVPRIEPSYTLTQPEVTHGQLTLF